MKNFTRIIAGYLPYLGIKVLYTSPHPGIQKIQLTTLSVIWFANFSVFDVPLIIFHQDISLLFSCAISTVLPLRCSILIPKEPLSLIHFCFYHCSKAENYDPGEEGCSLFREEGLDCTLSRWKMRCPSSKFLKVSCGDLDWWTTSSSWDQS